MPSEEIVAVSKAIEKSAECATQALQTGEKAGSFFARVFKEPIEAGVGMITDSLRFKRLRRWDQMADEVEEILVRRGIKETRVVEPKLGLPLLEAAALEEEPELQKLWSRLMANAMDPTFKEELRVAYSEMIKSLSPLDVKILWLMYNSLRNLNALDYSRDSRVAFHRHPICEKLGIEDTDYALSIANLKRLQCVAPHFTEVKLGNGLSTSGSTPHLSSYSGAVAMTPLGIRFVDACNDQRSEVVEGVRAHHPFNHTIDVHIPVGNW